MIALAAVSAIVIGTTWNGTNQSIKKKLQLEGNKNTANNNRSRLLHDPERLYLENLKVGNWPWGRPAIPVPSGTHAYYRKPTPHLSGIVDWSHEGNQWMRSPEFREAYVRNYRNAWTTELAQAVRNQLVSGFWHETITKGRVLFQENKADGVYNPNGVNLYQYQG